MSTLPENELDLEKLFLPAWAQQPSSVNRYAKFSGGEDREDRRGPRGPRGPRRDGPRPDFGPRPDRGPRPPRGDRPGQPGEQGRSGRPFGRPEDRRGPRPPRGPEGAPRQDDRREREHREPPPPLPEVNIRLVPDARGVEHLARQIKMTGRAYPLFDIAQMILQKPERHGAVFSVKLKPDGTVAQPLFVCALDDSLWLSEDELVAHVLRQHFATFYQAERTATEPPKGKYTFVAQCGMSGVIFGPPNYHDYQNRVRQLHAERFARMPFEVYKARIKIVRDEEVVKKWVEDQSWKTEYVCLNVPEPLKLGGMEAVERHFRETHAAAIIKPVESHTLSGLACRNLRCRELARLARYAVDEQRRFPLQLATTLSQQFASHGLQFFKVNRTVTHVSVARPHFLDVDASPISECIKRIANFINAHPKCTRRQLVEALAPTPPAPPPAAPAEVATTEASTAPAEGGEVAATAPVATPAPEATTPTEAQTEVIADLHWLIHQGHVIEFAKGVLETAKKPLPKPPPKPAPKAEEKPAEAPPETPVAAEAAPAAEPAPEGGEPAAVPACAMPEAEAAPSSCEVAPAPACAVAAVEAAAPTATDVEPSASAARPAGAAAV
jgi:hypothetical protein